MASEPIWISDLGLVEYREALALQERLRAARVADAIPDTVLLLEHWPVYTRGRRSGPEELPMGEDWYRSQGFDVIDTRRGGLVTYHGPGQLTGYVIMRIQDTLEHLRNMERAIVAALAEHDIDSHPRVEDGPAFTGVWVQDRKIASLGVHVSRGVTMHGFAVNVQNDLQPFSWIVPCGLDGVRMTSVIREQPSVSEPLPAFRERMPAHLAHAFGDRPAEHVDRKRLESAAPVLAA